MKGGAALDGVQSRLVRVGQVCRLALLCAGNCAGDALVQCSRQWLVPVS
jgi:hypothetical protein